MFEPLILNAGILIIGSLLWDKDRQEWRDERLDFARSELVCAPIRYGRKSGARRGHTYTMVFSQAAPAGCAKVVACSHTINSANDLMFEALKLWEAEALSRNTGRIAASWGCVALMCNPERNVPASLLNAWAQRVNSEPNYGNVSETGGEGSLISKEGILQIGWPRRISGGAALDLDLLLVTANDPTLTGTPPSYPSVETIVTAWNNAVQEHAEYFWNNTDHGITTFQDDAIRAGLRPRQTKPSDPQRARAGLCRSVEVE
ncbi:MAG TPA: hypothetical protein VHB45_15595 [Alloacidobacterium sp.]|nr:hypothetical protein [Alloacidobacterium sp.]